MKFRITRTSSEANPVKAVKGTYLYTHKNLHMKKNLTENLLTEKGFEK